MSRRIACFGDSNTYGYDPRSYLGDRYPEDIRWTARLARETGWEVLELGQNGREIPTMPWVPPQADLVVVMLGSNDLLQNARFTAEDTAARMEAFLTRPTLADRAVLLVAPPPMVRGTWITEDRLLVQSARLGGCYESLARRLGIAFADAADWDIPLLFDGVHFSPEGHQRFAPNLEQALKNLL